ncbi:hypothetical protein BBJ28_00016266 [Nothophytophthora sp. Chile5]|nr:hypothetical protein BBJ28_00016266 [Nothophytophthora sp. Chile5]
MDRVLSSAAKQEVLVRLVSSDPSLFGGLDSELLASITLSSATSGSMSIPMKNLNDRKPMNPRHDGTKDSTSTIRGKMVTEAVLGRPARKNIRLYSEETTLGGTKNPPTLPVASKEPSKAKRTPLTRATTVLLSPSSSATAVAATASTKKEIKNAIIDDRNKKAAIVRSTSTPATKKNRPAPIVLLDAGMLDRMNATTSTRPTAPQQQQKDVDERVSASSTPLSSLSAYTSLASYSTDFVKKKSRKPRTRGKKKNNGSTNNSEDDLSQRELAHAAERERETLMRIRSIEEQYEFGRPTTGLNDFSLIESSRSNNLASSAMTVDSMSNTSDSDEGQQVASSYVTASSTDYTIKSTTASRLLLDHRCFVTRDQWVPRRYAACYVCMREFRVLRKRHSCRMCGEVICSRCSMFREVDLPVLENKFRICSCCFVAYRKKMDDAEQQEQDEEADASDNSCNMNPAESVDASAASSGGSSSASPSPSTPPLPAPTSLFQASLSLSPSDTTSDRSSSRNTMNSMSDFSFCSDTPCEMSALLSNSFSASRNIEDELEAALKAKQLEKEVEASQHRIQALEKQIADQESQQDLLSTEQQGKLQDARATIKLLQEKLRMQELNAKQAAHNRDSICLSKLRQTELYTNADDESAALKKKLKILERQLQHAGISVAEVIPYAVAKQKVAEISKRLQEIGSSEVVLENKQAQAAARKEYYVLEQEMEKYHTALVMTDEYIEEQRRQEFEWEQANRVANIDAARLLRSAIPVDISWLSEKDLTRLETPTGAVFPAELARRLKRTNVLQLLRVNPKTIVKMHPSVIEGYRTTGLTLLERRALHHVMQEPFQEWKKQQKEEMAQKKYVWYSKLKDALVAAVANFEKHCELSTGSVDTTESEDGEDPSTQLHTCELLGLSCPVRSEGKVRKLYSGLGFSPDAEYFKEEILKSDPEGAGEKALLEAQAHAREMVANQRQRDLKVHYKMNMRGVAQALVALEEMDVLLERVRMLDEVFPYSPAVAQGDDAGESHECEQLAQCNSLLSNARELALLLAKRVGICLSGKRGMVNDEEDTRSPMEVREAVRAVDFLLHMLADIHALLFEEASVLREKKSAVSLGALKHVEELLLDVHRKNEQALESESTLALADAGKATKRVSWAERPIRDALHSADDEQTSVASSTNSSEESPASDRSSRRPPAVLPTSALLFDAIKARRKQNDRRQSGKASNGATNEKTPAPALPTPSVAKPMDLMAAIRSRKCEQSNDSTGVVDFAVSLVAPASQESNKTDAAKSA